MGNIQVLGIREDSYFHFFCISRSPNPELRWVRRMLADLMLLSSHQRVEEFPGEHGGVGWREECGHFVEFGALAKTVTCADWR